MIEKIKIKDKEAIKVEIRSTDGVILFAHTAPNNTMDKTILMAAKKGVTFKKDVPVKVYSYKAKSTQTISN